MRGSAASVIARERSVCHCEGAQRPKQSQGIDLDKQYCVYIMTNKRNTVLYTGVTSDLKKRVYEHKMKLVEGFTAKYNIVKLVYYEVFDDVEDAVMREKQIKAGSRERKVKLIRNMNSEWKDLYAEV